MSKASTARMNTASLIIAALAKSPNAKPVTITAKPKDLSLSLIVAWAVKTALKKQVRGLPPLNDILGTEISILWLGSRSKSLFEAFLLEVEALINDEIPPSHKKIVIDTSPGTEYVPSLTVEALILKILGEF